MFTLNMKQGNAIGKASIEYITLPKYTQPLWFFPYSKYPIPVSSQEIDFTFASCLKEYTNFKTRITLSPLYSLGNGSNLGTFVYHLLYLLRFGNF